MRESIRLKVCARRPYMEDGNGVITQNKLLVQKEASCCPSGRIVPSLPTSSRRRVYACIMYEMRRALR